MTAALSIFLVEDDPADQLLAKEAFGEFRETVRLHVFGSGQEALAALRDPLGPSPHVVLLDLNMPTMSGLEVLSAIRQDRQFQHLPVVMLTTSGSPKDITAGYELHATSFITKQPTFAGFQRQVDHFVRYWLDCRFSQTVR